MHISNIKSYAPKARKDFIAAITKQATKYGITAKYITPVEIKGDMALIGDSVFPASIAKARKALEERIKKTSFNQFIEQVAYNWFNRLCAIRYMELHDYLGHGRRVLSHPTEATGYQIIEDCLDIDLPGLNRQKVTELKLDGTKDEELYRELLLAQCHALHQAMPFLFEAVDDETELLLPENLTNTDSLIHDLTTEIPEEDWNDIEIIGWLYQFYISEKKDQVIGKVVKSEDIPAATQLFTPNWIVKYMVQNSLGAQWLATYPDSPLKAGMEYFIQPAEQTDEVNARLASITPSQLNPEELTLIDPACGSGHILVEAYELFKAIYLERGYRQRDVPQLILEKNIFGLDIDERAAQLTGFALMMKGRADDRRLFERGVKLNLMALVNSTGLVADVIAGALTPEEKIELVPSEDLLPYTLLQPTLSVSHEGAISVADISELIALFEHATTFGSLIRVPESLVSNLPALKQLSEIASQGLFESEALKLLGPLVQQAKLLAGKYDAVVANPPYMGTKGMNTVMKKFAKNHFPDAKSDLFACFIERGYTLTRDTGHNAMVTMQNWMFLSSFEQFRMRLLTEKTIQAMVRIGYNSFPSMNSKIAQATVFSLVNWKIKGFVSTFIDLNSAPQSANKEEVFLSRESLNEFEIAGDDFSKLPGNPIAFWATDVMRDVFSRTTTLGEDYEVRAGITTGENERFLLLWSEVDFGQMRQVGGGSGQYTPHHKGGEFRRWSGNREVVLKYGEHHRREMATRAGFRNDGVKYFFRPMVGWSYVTSGPPSFRFFEAGFSFDTTGTALFPRLNNLPFELLGLLNSKVVEAVLKLLNPTLTITPQNIKSIPVLPHVGSEELSLQLVAKASADWNAYERSWNFQFLPILVASTKNSLSLESSYIAWITQNREIVAEMKHLEEENNRIFIDAYGLADELTPEVPIEQITLTVNPAYRYGGKLTEVELWDRFRKDTMEELVSYTIGCMMGRYSLDTPGLIYAHSGNEGFEVSKYEIFPADDDGIIPITDKEWFIDDAANRVEEFISIVFPNKEDKSYLEQNLTFLADNLSSKKVEGPRDTLRRYLSDSFFKDHMQTYKKRPIYWLFSSGKQQAFQCLVYLHRYNEGTLARMRTEYVIPLTAKMASYEQKLKNDAEASDSAAEVKRLEKEIAKLHKQQAELSEFDEKLRHFADQRISLDLDDGVKVNYGKFGDLLSEVKVITGKHPEVSI